MICKWKCFSIKNTFSAIKCNYLFVDYATRKLRTKLSPIILAYPTVTFVLDAIANSRILQRVRILIIYTIFIVKNKWFNLIYLELGDNGGKLFTYWSIFDSEDDAGLHLWTILPQCFFFLFEWRGFYSTQLLFLHAACFFTVIWRLMRGHVWEFWHWDRKKVHLNMRVFIFYLFLQRYCLDLAGPGCWIRGCVRSWW
jgi:hypothetical protein